MPPKWVQFGFCLEPLVFVYPWLAIQIEPFPAWHLRLQWKYGKVIILAVCSSHFSASISYLFMSIWRTQSDAATKIHQLFVVLRDHLEASPLPNARHHRVPRLLDIYWPFIVEILNLHLPSKGRWRRQERRWLVGLRSSCPWSHVSTEKRMRPEILDSLFLYLHVPLKSFESPK